MSQWGSNMPAQPSGAGQVSFFDPSKFQKGVSDFPNLQSSQQNHASPAEVQQNTAEQNVSQNSWSAWGSWSGQDNQFQQQQQQPPLNDASNFNQQWYGQDQWNQNQQHSAVQHNQWDADVQKSDSAQQQNQWEQNAQHAAPVQNQQDGVNAQQQQQQQWDPMQQQNVVPQNHWDPNAQQWNQHYQQPYGNQYGGYNQYWGGDGGANGHEQGNICTGSHAASVERQSIENPDGRKENVTTDIAQSNDDSHVESEETESSESTSNNMPENSDDFDISQSTESGSLNHSLGLYEEGNMDGYIQKEEFVQENENVKQPHKEQAKSYAAGENVSGDMFGQHIGGHFPEASQVHSEVSNMFPPSSQPTVMSPTGAYQGTNEMYTQPAGTNQQIDAPYVFQQPTGPAPPAVAENVTTVMPVVNTAPKENQDESPAFGDWEMVPEQGATAESHSRNPSADNNVHFFIGSTNSSTRVSPAHSKGDDQDPSVSQNMGQNPGTGIQPGVEPVIQPVESVQLRSDPPPVEGGQNNQGLVSAPPTSLGPPPPKMGNSGTGNPFRKSPKPDVVASVNDISVLSSTHLDSTKNDFTNSPLVIDQSMSPIPPAQEVRAGQSGHPDLDSPELQMAGHGKSAQASTGKRESANVPPSPIMARKESPFQPPAGLKHNPGNDGRSKPVRASHDIPGVTSQIEKLSVNSEPSNNSSSDRKEHGVPGRNMDQYGRKTPDWDSREQRSIGRRTPDWDRPQRSERAAGRRGHGYEQERNVDQKRDDQLREDRRSDDYSQRRDKEYREDDRLSSRPPARPSSSAGRAPTRSRQSAFHHLQTSRGKNNVSPAASLWDTPDNLPTVSNILLMPAAGANQANKKTADGNAPAELTPVASLITSMSESITTGGTESDKKSESRAKTKSAENDRSGRDIESKEREPSGRSGYRDSDNRDSSERDTREELRGNRSYDSLRGERTLRDSRNNSREKLYGSRSSLDQDYPRERRKRGDSRERERGYRDKGDQYDRYRDRDRDRPPSRNGSTVDGYSRRDYRDRDYRDRDYRSRPDRYDRPRSRQGESRPMSRQGDSDRPRSRTDYDRDQHYRDRYRGYDYDDYYRRGGQSYYDRQYYDYDYYYGQYGHQGYYDEHGYYHPDPNARYDYYQRRSRTGTPGSLSDGGEEIANIADRSKHSETNSERKRFDYPPDLHDYSRGGGYDDYYSYYGYKQDGYRWDPDLSQWVPIATDTEPQRQTPEKFVLPHVRACFGPNGQLVKVLPNRPADGQPATVEVHDVQDLLEDEEESQELKEFPGPLVRGDTHKNDVLLFCQRKAKECSENIEMDDRESAELIWRFLELLIKQNGTVVGTDIADLLLQGHEPTTLDYRRTGVKIAASADNLEADDESEGSRVSRGTTPIDKSMVSKARPVEEVTDRFRHLLLYGRKKDALDWAMKNNLWGHALFLASKMDTRAHANVMTRFANVAMRMNDPLQTLYQLMSGRQPASVTCLGEEKWGEWRPHLAMILSNHTHKPDMDRKSITTLGDTLASRGFLHASHFCYLMSQTSFGSFNKKTSKIVLIGSSHNLPLQLFASNEAIQCTEIYEYALALGNTSISLANFQYFKYMYATRLINCGFSQEALQYCEVIARNINMNPAFYQHILVKLLYDLSSQLKYSDPERMEEIEDSPDPDWLRGLHTTLVQFEEGAIQPMSGSVTPAYFPGTTASSESGEVGMYMQGTENGYSRDTSNVPNSGPSYNIQEQSYIQHQSVGQQEHFQPEPMGSYGTDMTAGQFRGEKNPAETHENDTVEGQPAGLETHYNTTGVVPSEHQHAGGYAQPHPDGQYEQLSWPDQQITNHSTGYSTENGHQQHTDMHGYSDPSYAQYHQGIIQGGDTWSHGQQHQTTGFPPDVNLGESHSSAKSARSTVNRSSLASTSSVTNDEGEEDDENDVDDVDSGAHQGGGIFDLQPPQSKIIAPRLRKRTVSETSGGSAANATSHSGAKTEKKSDKDKDSLGSSKSKSAASGGGIWGKIGGLFRGKNEMKLPDDKEPSIVWDEDKKKWVDKDNPEADTAPAGPPPKDMDLSGAAPVAQPPSHAPVAPVNGPSSMPPPAAGNRFSRRKGIGARSQYVDVMNPKPATTSQVPSNLFNTLPSSHSAPAIFNPTGPADSSPQPQKSETIPEEKAVPGANNFPPPSEPSAQQLPPSTDSATDAPVPTALPTMFNPAQFQANQGFKPAAGGAGHRLSSRRVYPK